MSYHLLKAHLLGACLPSGELWKKWLTRENSGIFDELNH